MQELEENKHLHGIDDLSIVKYPKPFAWILQNPRALSPPQPHVPKTACRIWMHMEYPKERQRAHSLRQAAGNLNFEDENSIRDFVHECRPGLAHFGKYKCPYFRLSEKECDLNHKYYYASGNVDGMKSALMKSLNFLFKIAVVKDQVSCLQTSELKTLCNQNGIPFAKVSGVAMRKALLAHLISKIPHEQDGTMVSGVVEPGPVGEPVGTLAADAVASQPPPSVVAAAPKIQKKMSKKGSSDCVEGEGSSGCAKDPKPDAMKQNNADKSSQDVRGSIACKFFEPTLVVLPSCFT